MTKKISGLFTGVILGIVAVFCVVIVFSVLLGDFSSIEPSHIVSMLIVFITIGAVFGYLIGGAVSFSFVNFKAKTIAIVIIAMILTSIIPFYIDIQVAWMTLIKSEILEEGVMCFQMVRISMIGRPFTFLVFGSSNSCNSSLLFNPITFVFDFLIFLIPVSLIGYIFRKKQQF